MQKTALLFVLFALCAVSSVASLKLKAGSVSNKSDSDLFELEDELGDIVLKVQQRRALEEYPRVYAKYNENCEFDIESACAVEGYGLNFAICVGNEEHDIARDKVAASIVDMIMVAAAGPIYHAALAVGHAAQGNFARAADMALDAGLEALGDPTAFIRSIVASAAEEVPAVYAVCTSCAVAMAWALANKRIQKDIRSIPHNLAVALKNKFKNKDARSFRVLCPLVEGIREKVDMLDARMLPSSTQAQAQEAITEILAGIVENQIEMIRHNTLGKLKVLKSPFQVVFQTELKTAERDLVNVRAPSTEEVTPMSRGGWMVEDLSSDYFDDENDPLQFFKPSAFKYRNCQRVCGDGACDVRGCSRECGCVIA